MNFFLSFVLQFAASMLEFKVQLAPPTKNVTMDVLTPKEFFGRGDMPPDFEKSEKHLKRRNDVIPSP